MANIPSKSGHGPFAAASPLELYDDGSRARANSCFKATYSPTVGASDAGGTGDGDLAGQGATHFGRNMPSAKQAAISTLRFLSQQVALERA